MRINSSICEWRKFYDFFSFFENDEEQKQKLEMPLRNLVGNIVDAFRYCQINIDQYTNNDSISISSWKSSSPKVSTSNFAFVFLLVVLTVLMTRRQETFSIKYVYVDKWRELHKLTSSEINKHALSWLSNWLLAKILEVHFFLLFAYNSVH